MDMEDDKVADMVLKFPYEDITDVTVAIGDTFGDDVRGNDMDFDKVAQPGGQISN